MRSSAFLAYVACLGTVIVPARAPGSRPPATPSASAAAVYEARLRDLEARVRRLEELVLASKSRLLRLEQVALSGAVPGATARLVFRDEMGGSFRLARVQYLLDGAAVVSRVAPGEDAGDTAEGASVLDLAAAEGSGASGSSAGAGPDRELELWLGAVAPGPHELAVLVEYRGRGHGVFSYLEDYRFRITSSYAFTADEGKVATVRVIGFERGDLTTELSDRPALRFELESAPLRSPGAPDGAER